MGSWSGPTGYKVGEASLRRCQSELNPDCHAAVIPRASTPTAWCDGRHRKGVLEQGADQPRRRYTDPAVQAGEPMTAKVLAGQPTALPGRL
jgi:hypothetical protein